MAKKKKHASNYIDPGQQNYIKDLEAAGDTRSPKVKAQEQKIDQVFEPEQQEEDVGLLEKFWDTLTE